MSLPSETESCPVLLWCCDDPFSYTVATGTTSGACVKVLACGCDILFSYESEPDVPPAPPAPDVIQGVGGEDIIGVGGEPIEGVQP